VSSPTCAFSRYSLPPSSNLTEVSPTNSPKVLPSSSPLLSSRSLSVAVLSAVLTARGCRLFSTLVRFPRCSPRSSALDRLLVLIHSIPSRFIATPFFSPVVTVAPASSSPFVRSLSFFALSSPHYRSHRSLPPRLPPSCYRLLPLSRLHRPEEA
jgi:hypothetical protein